MRCSECGEPLKDEAWDTFTECDLAVLRDALGIVPLCIECLNRKKAPWAHTREKEAVAGDR